MIRLLIPALLAPGAAMAAWTWWRERQPRVPAAPDNHQGTDADALWTCRRIAATHIDPAGLQRLRNAIRKEEQ